MASEIEELSVAYEEEGVEVVQQLNKEILSKGAWTTIAFLYRDWDNRAEAYSEPKITLRRYRKVKGQYRQQSKFNISSMNQAEKIQELLGRWIADQKG